MKISSSEQIDKIIAEKRGKRVSELQHTTDLNQVKRREVSSSKTDSPGNALTRRSQSLLGTEFTSLFQSRNAGVQQGDLP